MDYIGYTTRLKRLNHFILWCKGWYEPSHSMSDIEQARIALILDGYLCPKSDNAVISILLNNLDALIKADIFRINLALFYSEIQKYQDLYNMSYNESILQLIKSKFAFELPRKVYEIEPPIYNRELFKKGFVAPKHFGNSYKLANYKAKKFLGIK